MLHSADSGNPGDSVWLNRRYPVTDLTRAGGKAWIQAGSRTAVTPQAFNDNGREMNACGKAGNRPDIYCTPWY